MVDPIDKYAVQQLKEFVLKTFKSTTKLLKEVLADKRLGDGSLPLCCFPWAKVRTARLDLFALRGGLCPKGWSLRGAEIL